MSEYRWKELFLRHVESDSLMQTDTNGFHAHESLPDFMIKWWRDALPAYGTDRIITATVNAAHRCVIGDSALCGQFCFAHAEKDGAQDVRQDIPISYVLEHKKLEELGREASIFLSTDIEPLPWYKDAQAREVTDITYRLLMKMVDHPPAGLILHTHTDISIKDDVLRVLKDVNQSTNLMVWVGFETDTEMLPNGLPAPCTTIERRLKTIEVLANHGIKTQAAVAPLVGFHDFEAFARRFPEIWAYRIMVGDLRLDFAIWWTKKAATLKSRLGLPAPSQEDAKAYFESLGYSPELVAYRDQFYVVLPERS